VLTRVEESRSVLRVLKRVFRRPRSARQLGERNPNDIKAEGCTATIYCYIKNEYRAGVRTDHSGKDRDDNRKTTTTTKVVKREQERVSGPRRKCP
jgi:hypothetical protein